MTAERRPRRPITIVVPVYGDLPSLLACVDALKRTVDTTVHRVLLANDNGPDADAIESALLAAITDAPGFSYTRNEQNLGFVGNCNRAVLELDDTGNDILLLNSDTIPTQGFLEHLREALDDDPRNGAVCPRSDNATIASLPFTLRRTVFGRSPERALAVHQAVGDLLPPYSVAPVAMGFCLLIRRDLIDQFGLFDEVFAPGYGEENDFCLRIARHGYRSLIAHRALVFHGVGKSFTGRRRNLLRSEHEAILVKRYPGYPAAVRKYVHCDRDPIDVFADAFAPGDDIARILIDIGTTTGRSQRLLDAADTAVRAGKARVTVVSRRPSRRHRALDFVQPERLDGLWDIALVGPDSPARRARLNRTSPRWLLKEQLPDEAAAVLAALLEGSRTPIPVDALRERWSRIIGDGFIKGASAPVEPRVRATLRRLQRRFPRLAVRARAVARATLIRRPLANAADGA